jgi:hypothetical protein
MVENAFWEVVDSRVRSHFWVSAQKKHSEIWFFERCMLNYKCRAETTAALIGLFAEFRTGRQLRAVA